MTGPKRSPLKYLVNQVPPGFLVDSRWLARSDVAKSSAHDYHRTGWLERIERGVYRRPSLNPGPRDIQDWKPAILSAQWIMDYDFHVGGSSALMLDGYGHYLPLGDRRDLYLYGAVPSWLPKLHLDALPILRRRNLFGSEPIGIEARDFDPMAPGAPLPWDWPIRRAMPERAILEALDELPDLESFQAIDTLFEGLANLRPRRLTELLTACRSVKVKRLFFLFADRHAHRWLSHVDRAAIDFGKGPRSLVQGGRYAAPYMLVVPEDFAGSGSSEAADGP